MSEEKTEVDSAVVELQKEVDLQRQYASQNDANFRKERQVTEDLQGKYTESESKLAGLAQELEALKTQQSNKSQYKEMDKDLTEESVRGNIEALQGQIGKLSSQLTQQANKISDYEKTEQTRSIEAQREAVKDELCTELDAEYDPKYRSKAVLLAHEKVNSGEVKPTRDKYDASKLLRACYLELVEAEKKKDPIPTDNGKGSKSVVKHRENKGTLKDVLKDMKKTFKLTKET
jgi:chromosome segregation ATPase